MNFDFIVVQIKLVFFTKSFALSSVLKVRVFGTFSITRKEANAIIFVSIFVCFDEQMISFVHSFVSLLGLCIDDDDDEFSESDYDDDNDDGNKEDDATDHDEL